MEKSTAKLFLKCTRWQLEETADLVSCPFFHCFCDSARHEDFPPAVDLLVPLFVVSSLGPARPSPDAVARVGPALLQLVYAFAIAFCNRVAADVRYSVLESSTVSGILHASLRLDGVLLPYYTGMAAMNDSTFSGVCATCVCRRRDLVVGGSAAGYRGWSTTTVLVAGTLCARMACRVLGEGWGSAVSRGISAAVEGLGWARIAADCVGLWTAGPVAATKRGLLDAGVCGGVCAQVFLNLVRVAFDVAVAAARKGNGKEKVLWLVRDVEMASCERWK